MSVFVDELREYPVTAIKPAARAFGKFWCHLWTDGEEEELHRFAAGLGLRRAWFQNHHRNPMLHHYDLTPSKRTRALQMGAIFKSIEEHAREIAAAIREQKDLDERTDTYSEATG